LLGYTEEALHEAIEKNSKKEQDIKYMIVAGDAKMAHDVRQILNIKEIYVGATSKN
jgi:hypothetical protein